MLEFKSYGDHDIDTDPIIFLKCGHFYSMSSLDGMMEIDIAYERNLEGTFVDLKELSSPGASKPKSCPDCRSVIHFVKRYGRIISFHRLHALEIKHTMTVQYQLQMTSLFLQDETDEEKG